MQQLKRRCWWCGTRLMAVSHAEVVDQDGRIVWVHKCCEEETRHHFKPLTAWDEAMQA